MALTLKYVGARAYTEFAIKGVKYGFGRGRERDDVPDWWIEEMILPNIANGGTMWEVIDTKGKDIGKAAIEALEAEPEPEPEIPEI